MIKTCKDAKGTKVKIGDLVSILDETGKYDSIFQVESMERRRRSIELLLVNPKFGYVYTPSKNIISEL